MKPKLLMVELWGIGDVVIATPFLRAAAAKFEVTLLAKPFARELQPRLWPGVRVESLIAPWTSFKYKYHFWRWPLGEILREHEKLMRADFDFGVSARWDPRDHLLLKMVGAENRMGFPRLRSQMLLTQPLVRPEPQAHRYESWRVIATALGLTLPPREAMSAPAARMTETVLIHTGAGQPVRVWPLERYQNLMAQLRRKQFQVQVVCDPSQREWWLRAGETTVATPATVTELFALIDGAGAFIGNDSGPGHLAAVCGVPTFTVFGPQLPEWFVPLHPQAEWVEGRACPYKPCSDYCRFPTPHCLGNISEEEVWVRVERFVSAHLQKRQGSAEAQL